MAYELRSPAAYGVDVPQIRKGDACILPRRCVATYRPVRSDRLHLAGRRPPLQCVH
jgi:hypothetical protein